MDLKTDDIFNIDIDPALLLSYELDKLNLDNIPNDYLELSYEIPKNDVNLDAENDILSGDNKITEATDSKCSENCAVKSSTTVDKSCSTEVKVEASSKNTKRKKDINGNEEVSSDENLNQLFDKLELSDSDNEEADDGDSSKLRERGPVRPPRQTRRNRHQNNIWSRNESQDKSLFNTERLRFWSGSSQIQSNETATPNQSAILNNLTFTFSGSEPIHTLSSQDSFYDDSTATSVSSPESGYESAQSIAGSPPPAVSTCLNLDIIPETVDEQNILDFLIDNTGGALTDNNLPVCNTDEKDAKGKIKEIYDFLIDIPAELLESTNAVKISDGNVPDNVPLVNHSEDLNTNSVTLSSASCNSASKNVETPKKLVYKLDDKAKHALRDFLSKDEFYIVKKRIYKKISEDIVNKEDVKVIYVEDEMDKASENRTNLHHAVLDSKIEDIYCLVEIHKQYNKPFTDINIRDKYGKTALDYAVQKQMTLVVDYLKENTACQSVNI